MGTETATPKSTVERERKFDVDPNRPIPHLAGAGPVVTQGEPVESTLHATYYDTADHELARAGITLRRRTGGDDAGWHLKLPTATPDNREEVSLPADGESTTVPPELAERVAEHTEGRELVPIAHLKTDRRTYHLADDQGRTLATLTDDAVAGETIGDDLHLDGWRELEIELAPNADPGLLDILGNALIRAGARPAHWPSKLRRLLGEDLAGDETELGKRSTAAEVVLAYLSKQVDAVRRHDLGVRENAEDAVHQLRVALRRLRSALSSFRNVLDRAATRPLSDELRWAAGELGPARDTEVLRARVSAELTALPTDAVRGRADVQLAGHFEQEATAARKRALDLLHSGRYAAMLAALQRLLSEPPLTAAATNPARAELKRAIERAHRRLTTAVESLNDLEPGPDRDAGLHEVRKKAKQARYAADAVRPIAGKGLRRWQRAVKKVQDTLGEHHDSVVARGVLSSWADTAGAAAFTYGVLYQRSLDHSEALEATFFEQWRAVPDPT
jgi:CHAD domain-containing protein